MKLVDLIRATMEDQASARQDLAEEKRPQGIVHLIGAGGSGVGALARIMLDRGHQVTGSDSRNSPRLDLLRQMGARIVVGHGPSNISPAARMVVASASIPQDNPEIVEARRLDIPVRKYAEALGGLFAQKKTRIAVAGTHGKTTVTGLVAYIMAARGMDPGYLVGAPIPSLGRSASWGTGSTMAVEACEFDRSFLHLSPNIAVVTNVEADHLDYYRDLAEIQDAFIDFASRIPENGVLIVHESAAGVFQDASVARGGPVACRIVSYGESSAADWSIDSVNPIQGGGLRFRISHRGQIVDHALGRLCGRHNALNSLAALLAVREAGVPMRLAIRCLPGYSGAQRRLQQVADLDGIRVMDDFAHHPTEVRAALEAVRSSYGPRRLIAVFQPHQHSRTRIFLEQFSDALGAADEVIIPQIYAARDKPEDIESVRSEDLVAELVRRGTRASFCKELDQIVHSLAGRLTAGDMVLTMGAGDVHRVAFGLGERLREAS